MEEQERLFEAYFAKRETICPVCGSGVYTERISRDGAFFLIVGCLGCQNAAVAQQDPCSSAQYRVAGAL